VLLNSFCDSANQVDTTIRQSFKSEISSLSAEVLGHLVNNHHAKRIFVDHRHLYHVVALDLVECLAFLEDRLGIWVSFLKELIHQRNSWSGTEAFNRHPADLSLCSLVFDIVRILNEVASEAHEIPVLLTLDSEINMPAFSWEWFIKCAWVVSLYKNSLAKTCAWSDHNFHTSWTFKLFSICAVSNCLAVFVLQSAHTVSSSCEVVDKGEAVKSTLVRNLKAI
jgi:hypothetical protein